MFARKVEMHLKPNCIPELTQKLEKEIIPLLRKQNGGVAKMLDKVVEGAPKVESYEVSNSTFHKIAAHVAA